MRPSGEMTAIIAFPKRCCCKRSSTKCNKRVSIIALPKTLLARFRLCKATIEQQGNGTTWSVRSGVKQVLKKLMLKVSWYCPCGLCFGRKLSSRLCRLMFLGTLFYIEEVLRRFPYWDELHGAFGTTTTVTTTTTTTIAGSVSSRSTMTTMTTHDNSNIVGWPMSIKSIIHNDEKEQRKQDQQEQQQQQSLDQHHHYQGKRQQQLPSLSSMLPYHPTTNINHEQQQQAVATATFAAATAHATLTNAKATTARVIPLSKCTRAFIVSTAIAGNEKTTTVSSPEYVPSSPPTTTTTTTTRHPIHHHESSSASGIAYPYYYHHHGVKRRHHHEAMVLAQEQEKTRRVRARADLVKHLVQTGYSKDEIAAELKLCSWYHFFFFTLIPYPPPHVASSYKYIFFLLHICWHLD